MKIWRFGVKMLFASLALPYELLRSRQRGLSSGAELISYGHAAYLHDPWQTPKP